jgi:flagellar basal-body rod protein FlgG
MIRGIYTAASSMLAASYRQTAAANNIANVSTTGYRAETTSNRSFADLLVVRMARENVLPFGPPSAEAIGAVGTGTLVDTSIPSLVQGPLEQTDSPLDLALTGEGFFVVQSPAGPILTRDGHFSVDADGRMVTSEGFLVLGQNGPITLAPGALAVAADGTITLDDRPIDRLRIESYAAADLERVGPNGFIAVEGAQAQDVTATATQGALEGANVDATQLMTDMLKISSTFQSAQRVFQTLDGTLGKIVNDVARF